MPLRDHPTSLALAAGRAGTPPEPWVAEHLDACPACRVRAARLRHAEGAGALESAPPQSIRRIASASAAGPPLLAGLDTAVPDPAPRPGQLWRAGDAEALLVWVRSVSPGGVEVIPAVLDVELADAGTLLLPAAATALGLDLALITGVRVRIDRQAFLQPVADLAISGDVEEVIAAAGEGRRPRGVSVGPPIEVEADQRIEYQRAITDVLAGLAPAADGLGAREEADIADLVALLADALPARHPDTRVRGIPLRRYPVDRRRELRCCARVSYLDSSLVVAVLAGAGAGLPDPAQLAPACLDMLRCEPVADAVAVTVLTGDLPTVVLTAADLRVAYEPPGGDPRGPRQVSEPLAVVDALAKHVDRQATAWEITEPITSVLGTVDVAALVTRNARAAASRLSAEGRRAVTPAKKAAWANLPADFAARIAAAVVAISDHDPLPDVLAHLGRQDDA
jgi:hypothetical protein